MDGSRSTERLRATVRVQAFARTAARASPNPRIARAVAPTAQAAMTTTIASVPTPPTTVEPPVRGRSLTPAPRSPSAPRRRSPRRSRRSHGPRARGSAGARGRAARAPGCLPVRRSRDRAVSARAFASRSSAIPDRGLPPSARRRLSRVWRRSATTYRLRLSSTCTCRTASIASRSSTCPATGPQVLQGRLRGLLGKHARLVGVAGVADRHPHGEPVELRLGQRVGALVLHRVLGRDHQERALENVRLAVHGDLCLLHRLEQRRLGLRRCAVDLVDEQDVREHRAPAGTETTRFAGRRR